MKHTKTEIKREGGRMIIYKCDLCGKKIQPREIVTVRAVRADISRGFDICGECYNDIANKAKAIAEGDAEILFADGVKIAERAGEGAENGKD